MHGATIKMLCHYLTPSSVELWANGDTIIHRNARKEAEFV